LWFWKVKDGGFHLSLWLVDMSTDMSTESWHEYRHEYRQWTWVQTVDTSRHEYRQLTWVQTWLTKQNDQSCNYVGSNSCIEITKQSNVVPVTRVW